ncbi:putative lumazine-binding protein [Favolaschia claudopus]|uniref:Lumazine-binding protein n=1 Tax=Favolaschia claudopus TaxID=2862362 RepID=A0AAW0DIQ9_9AGAR
MKYSKAGLTEDQLAVLAVAETFLECIEKRDKATMLSTVLPSGGATLLRNGEPLFINLVGVVERIPFDHPQKLSEVISAKPTVMVDPAGEIAMAWTPYEFYFDDVLHHVGTNIWSFLKREGKWMISGVADNSLAPGA